MYIIGNKNIQEIILLFILLFISCYITKYKELSLLLLIILLYLLFYIFKNSSFKGRYVEKTILSTISLFILLYGINYNNYYINNYSISLLMFVNILILLRTCSPFKTIYDYISFIGILILLITFDFSKWKVINMKLVNVDYNWIYLKTFVLTILYIYSSCVAKNYNLKLLIPLYAPFLFPLNEYIIHRTTFFALGILYAFL